MANASLQSSGSSVSRPGRAMISGRSIGSVVRGRIRRRTEPTASTDAEIGGGATAAGSQGRHGGGRGCTGQFGDRLQQLLAIAERYDADVLEVVVCQPAQQLAVDMVGAEHFGIWARPILRSQPSMSKSVPWLLSAAVLKGLSHGGPRDSKGFLQPTLDSPCGRQLLDSSIAAPSRDTRPI